MVAQKLCVGGGVDMTSQILPEGAGQELRASEERFRLLVEAVKDYGIYMLDVQGRVATWNAGAQAFTGYAPGEIIGRHFSVFSCDEDRASGKPDQELKIAVVMGRFEDEGWRVRKDGTLFWANVLITAMRDDAGTLVGFAKVTRDLTERRRAEMEFEENLRMHETNRLKSEFLAHMSHELRTPLNAIIGFAELMYTGKVGPVSGDHKEYLGDILGSSRHLLQLINDVLDLAKVESGKLDFRPEPVDLVSLVNEVRDVVRGLASAKRIHLEAKVDASITGAVLDASKLKQVLYNYLSNALKFTPDEGRVTIHVVRDLGDCIRVEVEDTGIGIKSEDTHRLFIAFQQLEAGAARKYAGTGLGLAVTKRIVEGQGGRVGVRSVPGKGSTFWAVLPRKTTLAPPPDSQQTPVVAVEGNTRTVLVVDDSPAAQRLVQATLRPVGYSTLGVSKPLDALRALEHATPAAVILDILLPEMDGFELLERIRAMPRMRSVPIVIWTIMDLSEDDRTRLFHSAQRIVLKAQDGSEGILEALGPWLLPGGDPNGR
jgi:PAS domain S-box-containing protein